MKGIETRGTDKGIRVEFCILTLEPPEGGSFVFAERVKIGGGAGDGLAKPSGGRGLRSAEDVG